jgi:glutaredoxin
LRAEGYSERAIFVIDKKGFIRYVDVHDIDQQPDNEELFRVLEKLDPGRTAWTPPQLEETPEPEAEIVLYCTPWCPDCRKARAYFQARSLDFVEVDISKDASARTRVRAWAGGKEITPTIKIRGQVVIDWQPDKLDQLLEG